MRKFLALTGIIALAAVATPAFASTTPSTIVVKNDNAAVVTNVIEASASSGSNISNGAEAYNKVEGGNVSESDYNNKAGNAGGTILGGLGGEIRTGNATVSASVANEVNTSRTRVAATPWAVGEIRVKNLNAVEVGNSLSLRSASGDNTSNGAGVDNRVCGGNIENVGSSNVAGNGGSHVEGGSGGIVVTGTSATQSDIVNVLNRTITRIRK